MTAVRQGGFALRARGWCAVALLCLSASAAIVYPAMTKFPLLDPGLGGARGDVGMYVRMYSGEPLAEIARPFRYRIFTPYLARALPDGPHALLRYFDMTPDKLVQFRFGIVDFFGLAVCGMAMVALCESLGFALLEALLAAMCFYTAFPVVNFGGTAMVDTWAHAFLLLGIVSLLRGQRVLPIALSLVGMLAKETTALLVPIALLLPGTTRTKIGRVAALAPGLVGYVVFRWWVAPGGYGFPGDPVSSLTSLAERLQRGPYLLWILFDGGTAFLGLWVLAAIGWTEVRRRPTEPLARLAWLVPPVMAMPFLIGSNIGRIWFYAFPAVIPLAVVGVRRLLSRPA